MGLRQVTLVAFARRLPLLGKGTIMDASVGHSLPREMSASVCIDFSMVHMGLVCVHRRLHILVVFSLHVCECVWVCVKPHIWPVVL